jgi:hypothetical protein
VSATTTTLDVRSPDAGAVVGSVRDVTEEKLVVVRPGAAT